MDLHQGFAADFQAVLDDPSVDLNAMREELSKLLFRLNESHQTSLENIRAKQVIEKMRSRKAGSTTLHVKKIAAEIKKFLTRVVEIEKKMLQERHEAAVSGPLGARKEFTQEFDFEDAVQFSSSAAAASSNHELAHEHELLANPVTRAATMLTCLLRASKTKTKSKAKTEKIQNDDDNDDVEDCHREAATLTSDGNEEEEEIPELLTWFLGLVELGKSLGLDYKPQHIFLMLVKCRIVITKIHQLLLLIITGNKEVPNWLQALADSKVDPAHVCSMIFACFLYTVDCKLCQCETLESCKAKPKSHFEKSAAPVHTTVHGYNIAPWAVVNWALRVANDPNTNQELRPLLEKTIVAFQPFIEWLTKALAVLPHQRRITYRGITVSVATKYRLKTNVLWGPFSSTSLSGKIALQFMQGKSGTFFIIRCYSGAMIDFASWFPEQDEALLSINTSFVVQNKMSRTLLQMLGNQFDVIQMVEQGDEPTIGEQIEEIQRAVTDTTFVYEPYLKVYVQGRVASAPPPQPNTTKMFDFLIHWVSYGAPYLLLLGSAGTGKTSAVLACLSKLVTTSQESIYDRPILPVFISLPTVDGLTLNDGMLDKHVLATLNVSEEVFIQLVCQLRVVLLLDSLDEIPLEGGSMEGLIDRNPLAAKCKVLMSCRDEFVISNNIQPPTKCIAVNPTKCDLQFMQPFEYEDVVSLAQGMAGPDAPPDIGEKQAQNLKSMGLTAEAFGHPCTVFMALVVDQKFRNFLPTAAASKVETEEASTETLVLPDVYEAYLQGSISGSPDCAKTMAGMEAIAVSMLTRGHWHVTVGEALLCFEGLEREEARRHLSFIPRRVEDDFNDESMFCFWHKTIGEYLAARALWKTPEKLRSINKPFSTEAPVVIGLFGQIATATKAAIEIRDSIVVKHLVPMIQASRSENISALDLSSLAKNDVLSTASNAMALLCASDTILSAFDFSGIQIYSANLHSARLHGAQLRAATFHSCVLNNVSFDWALVEGLSLIDCGAGMPLPPLEPKVDEDGDEIVGLGFAADAVFTVGSQSPVSAFSGRSGKLLAHSPLVANEPRSLAVSPDASALVVGCTSGHVHIFAISRTMRKIHALIEVTVLDIHAPAEVSCAVFTPDSQKLVTAGSDGSIAVIDPHDAESSSRVVRIFSHEEKDDNDEERQEQKTQKRTHHITAIAVAPRGNRVAAAYDSGRLILWEDLGVKELEAYQPHSVGITNIAFGGTVLVTASKDGTCAVGTFDTVDRKRVMFSRKFTGHRKIVRDVVLSPDESLAISVSDDHTAMLWSIATASTLGTMGHGNQKPTRIVLSPFGTLFTSCSDCKIYSWYFAVLKPPRTLSGHSGTIISICPIGDTHFATIAEDGTLYFWRSDCRRSVGECRLPLIENETVQGMVTLRGNEAAVVVRTSTMKDYLVPFSSGKSGKYYPIDDESFTTATEEFKIDKDQINADFEEFLQKQIDDSDNNEGAEEGVAIMQGGLRFSVSGNEVTGVDPTSQQRVVILGRQDSLTAVGTRGALRQAPDAISWTFSTSFLPHVIALVNADARQPQRQPQHQHDQQQGAVTVKATPWGAFHIATGGSNSEDVTCVCNAVFTFAPKGDVVPPDFQDHVLDYLQEHMFSSLQAIQSQKPTTKALPRQAPLKKFPTSINFIFFANGHNEVPVQQLAITLQKKILAQLFDTSKKLKQFEGQDTKGFSDKGSQDEGMELEHITTVLSQISISENGPSSTERFISIGSVEDLPVNTLVKRLRLNVELFTTFSPPSSSGRGGEKVTDSIIRATSRTIGMQVMTNDTTESVDLFRECTAGFSSDGGSDNLYHFVFIPFFSNSTTSPSTSSIFKLFPDFANGGVRWQETWKDVDESVLKALLPPPPAAAAGLSLSAFRNNLSTSDNRLQAKILEEPVLPQDLGQLSPSGPPSAVLSTSIHNSPINVRQSGHQVPQFREEDDDALDNLCIASMDDEKQQAAAAQEKKKYPSLKVSSVSVAVLSELVPEMGVTLPVAALQPMAPQPRTLMLSVPSSMFTFSVKNKIGCLLPGAYVVDSWYHPTADKVSEFKESGCYHQLVEAASSACMILCHQSRSGGIDGAFLTEKITEYKKKKEILEKQHSELLKVLASVDARKYESKPEQEARLAIAEYDGSKVRNAWKMFRSFSAPPRLISSLMSLLGVILCRSLNDPETNAVQLLDPQVAAVECELFDTPPEVIQALFDDDAYPDIDPVKATNVGGPECAMFATWANEAKKQLKTINALNSDADYKRFREAKILVQQTSKQKEQWNSITSALEKRKEEIQRFQQQNVLNVYIQNHPWSKEKAEFDEWFSGDKSVCAMIDMASLNELKRMKKMPAAGEDMLEVFAAVFRIPPSKQSSTADNVKRTLSVNMFTNCDFLGLATSMDKQTQKMLHEFCSRNPVEVLQLVGRCLSCFAQWLQCLDRAATVIHSKPNFALEFEQKQNEMLQPNPVPSWLIHPHTSILRHSIAAHKQLAFKAIAVINEVAYNLFDEQCLVGMSIAPADIPVVEFSSAEEALRAVNEAEGRRQLLNAAAHFVLVQGCFQQQKSRKRKPKSKFQNEIEEETKTFVPTVIISSLMFATNDEKGSEKYTRNSVYNVLQSIEEKQTPQWRDSALTLALGENSVSALRNTHTVIALDFNRGSTTSCAISDKAAGNTSEAELLCIAGELKQHQKKPAASRNSGQGVLTKNARKA